MPVRAARCACRSRSQPGDTAAVHRFDVLQHDRKGIVGGARVMVIAVPEELLEPYQQAQGA